MSRNRNHLLSTALACVRRGIPVRPAPPMRREPGRFLRPTWVCDCGNPDCDAPGSHPIEIGWITRPRRVHSIWDTTEPPNLLVTSSETVAIWRLPQYAGGYGRLLYEKQNPSVWPPTMRRPDGDWITCTLPADLDTLPLAEGVVYMPPGVPILIPPSRLRNGRRARWDGNHFPRHPLPSAEAVLATVVLADQHQRSPSGR